jgi:hypothetical protein
VTILIAAGTDRRLGMDARTVRVAVLLVFSVLIIFAVINAGQAQKSENNFSPVIPKTWEDAAVRALELPLVKPAYSPVHVSSDYYYYRMPVRPIYKSYPIYARGKEPAGYLEWLRQQEPEIVFDATKVKTEADWIRAGELVFDAPIGYRAARATATEPEFDDDIKMPITKHETIPFQRYVIRKKVFLKSA